MAHKLWSKEELILAFNLYLKIEFGKTHAGNPKIVELANLLNRSPASIVMRLGNFASIDPYHQQRGVGGLPNGKKQVQPIWDEFFNNQEELIFLSEKILASKQKLSIETKYQDILADLPDKKGEYVLKEVKTRVNQSVFREIILANYSNKCAITGIDIPELLTASHIIPWSKSEEHRLNPENGICLSPLFDKAFDKGLISFTADFRVKFSSELKDKIATKSYSNIFEPVENLKISQPIKYLPRIEFLEYHQKHIFKK